MEVIPGLPFGKQWPRRLGNRLDEHLPKRLMEIVCHKTERVPGR